MSLAIEVCNVSRRFGSKQALDNLAFSVPTGKVCGFLGPNGSGKTTTIRTLLGLIKPDSGNVKLNGIDIRTDRLKALNGVAAIVENPALYVNLTGRETLKMSCDLLKIERSKIAEMLELVNLTQDADRKVKEYSLGMKQRIAIGRALLGEPRLLILDEPTNGLDPAGISAIRELITSLPKNFSTTVMLSSHLLSEVEQVADHCVLINKGKVVFANDIGTLTESSEAQLQICSETPEQLHGFLLKRNVNAELRDGEIYVRGAFSQQEQASLLGELVKENFAIYHFSVHKPNLEQLFIQLTNKESEQ